jgi:hypothetical protein
MVEASPALDSTWPQGRLPAHYTAASVAFWQKTGSDRLLQ